MKMKTTYEYVSDKVQFVYELINQAILIVQ